MQVDVKYVPRECMSKELKEIGERYYQYTAIDEYTRLRYTYFCKEHTTYESTVFLNKLIKYFPFKIELIQTDNGFEFTNKLNWNGFYRNKKTMFEKRLEELEITHNLIRPHTPTQNGKVERSHRNDQERFYNYLKFYSFEDLQKQMAAYLRRSNNIPISVLNWRTPLQKRQEIQLASNARFLCSLRS